MNPLPSEPADIHPTPDAPTDHAGAVPAGEPAAPAELASAATPAADPAPAADPSPPAAESSATAAVPAAAPKAPELSPAACAAALAQHFPALFGAGVLLPVKLRIQTDIQQRVPGVFSRKALSLFLHRHTTSTAYIRALLAAQNRFDLDGQPAGDISEEHRAAAVTEMDRRKAIVQERRAAERQNQRPQRPARVPPQATATATATATASPTAAAPGEGETAGAESPAATPVQRPPRPGGARPPRPDAQQRRPPGHGRPEGPAGGRANAGGPGRADRPNRPDRPPRAHGPHEGAGQASPDNRGPRPARDLHARAAPGAAPESAAIISSGDPVADAARRERSALLRSFEGSTLTKANFLVLKRMTEADLDAQLALARQERQPGAPRDDRPPRR